ncbi:hypothetical protein Tco_0970184 [Tanacetum coccineum]
MSKVLQKRGSGSLPSSTETNLRDHVKLISTAVEANIFPIRRAKHSVMPFSTYTNLGLRDLVPTKLIVELADITMKRPKGIAKNVLVDFAVLEDMDAYRDKEVGDVIVGKEVCKEIKIPPLLKVSAQDKLQGISHPYKKLKRLYKGVLNLGTEYIKDDKVKEWLTRGHVSVYEMEW